MDEPFKLKKMDSFKLFVPRNFFLDSRFRTEPI